MSFAFSDLHGMIMGILRNKAITDVTLEAIRDLARDLCEKVGNDNAKARLDEMIEKIQNEYGVVSYEGVTLTSGEDHREWLDGVRKSEIKWTYWNAYRDFALEVPPSAKQAIDRDTDIILGRLEDPVRDGAWSTKGLMMGSVQAGKTANYIGLMAKAMDAGYRVIIVMTGIHESLRAQTQLRVNQGLLGYIPTVTGGRLDWSTKDESSKLPRGNPKPYCFTTATEGGDFNAAVAKVNLQQMISQPGSRIIFIVKKNPRILRNLYAWLSAVSEQIGDRQIIHRAPALIIDDEADQASVDTGVVVDDVGEQYGDPTVINSLARGLCSLFERSAYVSVTATPFANILIHQDAEGGQRAIRTRKEDERFRALDAEVTAARTAGRPAEVVHQIERDRDQQGITVFLGRDLFPRNFVHSLKPPDNYFGAGKFFGISNLEEEESDIDGEPLPIVASISDHCLHPGVPDSVDFVPVGKMVFSHKPKGLPGSLKFAIRTFLLSSACRNLRDPEHDKVNTMLVHATRFTRAQGEMKELVEYYVEELGNAVRNQEDHEATNAGRDLKAAYDNGGYGVTGVSEASAAVCARMAISARLIPGFSEVYAELRRMFSKPNCIVPLEVNGTSRDALIYRGKTDYSVIVVGGDKLSRGLTLNGLIVSYYLRSSNMYDSLMQMGRWFGYRERYVDLMRIFTTDMLLERFAHIALAERKLREEFDMLCSSPNATPESFGLKILAHPEMTVSSPIKVRHGEIVETEVNLAGQTSETTFFGLDNRYENATLVLSLAAETRPKKATGNKGCKVVCKAVDWSVVVGFLRKYQPESSDGSKKWGVYADYIMKLAKEKREVVEWTVVFRSSDAPDPNSKELAESYALGSFSPDLPELMFPLVRTVSSVAEGKWVRIKAAGGQLDEIIDLTEEQRERAKKLTADWKAVEETRRISIGLPVKETKGASEYLGRALRVVRDPKVGILQLYPLVFKRKGDGGTHEGLEGVHWGFRLSFPGNSSGRSISYVVNSVYSASMADDTQEDE